MGFSLKNAINKVARSLSKGAKNVSRGVSKEIGKAGRNVTREAGKLVKGPFKNASPKKLAMQESGGSPSQVEQKMMAGPVVKGKSVRLPGFGSTKKVMLNGALSPSQVRQKMMAGPVIREKEDDEEKMQKPFRKGGAVTKKPMARKTGRAVMRKTSDVKGRAMKKGA